MPKPLTVTIPHSLGKEEAVRRLKSGIDNAAASVPILNVHEQQWNGDRLSFRVSALGQVASGTVDVEQDYVRLQVLLPWMLAKFADAVARAIKTRGRPMLEKK
jgi:Putative polyhydroxyalkanoic acid system protein (PHA_gran_rgn)